ncbi:MAG: amidohydrolase [Actinomycetota bacterium]
MDLTVYPARLIRTMNPALPTASAVAVCDGRIVEVGTMETLQPWLDAHPHRIDTTFADKVILPGFIDPHLHPSLAAILLPMHFITALPWDLPDRIVPGTTGADAYLAELRRIEAEMGSGDEPLHTWGFHTLWHGQMHREVLNRISDTRPIVVWQRSFHEIYVNDRGLDWLGLDRDRLADHPQVDLEAGRFFESGKLLATSRMTGYLTDPARFRHGLELTKAAVHAGGHTTIGDLTGTYFDTEEEWAAMCAVLGTDDTPFRVQMIPSAARGIRGAAGLDGSLALVQERAKRSTEKLFYRKHVKLFTDGGFFAQLMQLLPPGYIDGHHGEWMFAPEQFEDLARRYWHEGYQIHVHCTGDLGVELALDVLAKLQWERPRFDHRFTIEHFGLSTPEQVRRIKELGAVVSANVYYVHELGEAYWTGSIGHERASQMARLGTLQRHGVVTAIHSDFTMAPAKPLTNAWVALNRIGEAGTVLAPEERIDVDAAMRAITIDAAIVLGMENEIGSIRAGKLADFTVLEADPYDIAPTDLADIPIWGTVFEGAPFPLEAPAAR